MTKAKRTKQFIIEQSAPIFNTKGLSGTSMSDIMEVTKMAKGGIYGHFESKEELSQAVVEYNLAKLLGVVKKEVDKRITAREKLFNFIDVFENPLRPPVEGGCPMINFGSEADDTNIVVKTMVKNALLTAQKLIIAIIEMGISKGEFVKTFNPKQFCIKMTALIEGGIFVSRTLNTNTQMKVIVKILKEEIELNMV